MDMNHDTTKTQSKPSLRQMQAASRQKYLREQRHREERDQQKRLESVKRLQRFFRARKKRLESVKQLQRFFRARRLRLFLREHLPEMLWVLASWSLCAFGLELYVREENRIFHARTEQSFDATQQRNLEKSRARFTLAVSKVNRWLEHRKIEITEHYVYVKVQEYCRDIITNFGKYNENAKCNLFEYHGNRIGDISRELWLRRNYCMHYTEILPIWIRCTPTSTICMLHNDKERRDKMEPVSKQLQAARRESDRLMAALHNKRDVFDALVNKKKTFYWGVAKVLFPPLSEKDDVIRIILDMVKSDEFYTSLKAEIRITRQKRDDLQLEVERAKKQTLRLQQHLEELSKS